MGGPVLPSSHGDPRRVGGLPRTGAVAAQVRHRSFRRRRRLDLRGRHRRSRRAWRHGRMFPRPYCPTRPVSRGEMAALLSRALDLPMPPPGTASPTTTVGSSRATPLDSPPPGSRAAATRRPTTTSAPTGRCVATRWRRSSPGRWGCPPATAAADQVAGVHRGHADPPRRLLRGCGVRRRHESRLRLPADVRSRQAADRVRRPGVVPSRGAADGKVEGLSGYPLFSAPPEVADALAWTGCDGCSTASNHSIDQGFSGLVETLEVLETAGLGQAGTAATEEGSKQTTLYDVDGVSVAHFAATWWLNGLQLPAEAPWSVDLDVDRILSQGATARAAGADFVVVSIHCCVEYRALPTSYQVAIGEALIASPDVDLVVGHHAHVVQPIDVVDGEFIVYGLGTSSPGSSGRRRPPTASSSPPRSRPAGRGGGRPERSTSRRRGLRAAATGSFPPRRRSPPAGRRLR